MRKSFATSIEEDIQQGFKDKCKVNNLKMNDVLEIIMKAYISGDIDVKSTLAIDVKPK